MFLVLHILTSVLDSFASISIVDAIVPFVGSYRPFWLGLGAVAFDLILAVIVTSLLRARMGYSTLARDPLAHLRELADRAAARLRHRQRRRTAAGCWLLSIACTALVVAAVLTRVLVGWPESVALARRGARRHGGASRCSSLLWLPAGPLGSEWARRSGTPTALLGHHSSAKSGGSHR